MYPNQTIKTLVVGSALLLCLVFVQLFFSRAATAAPSLQTSPDVANAADNVATAAAVGTTFNVTSPNCAGPGSIVEAIGFANANPGPDTISITPSLQIYPINPDACGTTMGDPSLFYLAKVTEDLIIEANGASLKGNQLWTTLDGKTNVRGSCPSDFYTNVVAQHSPGFLNIDPAVSVEISDLKVVNLSAFVRMGQDSSLHLKGSDLSKILDFYSNCERPAIQRAATATTTNVTIEDSKLHNIVNAQVEVTPVQPPFAATVLWLSPMIDGVGGVLSIKNSTFENGQGVAVWEGGTVNVESSEFVFGSGWLSVYNGTTVNIVNSAFGLGSAIPSETREYARIYADQNSTVNIRASTFVVPYTDCAEKPITGGGSAFCVGGPGTFLAKNGSTINFVESAFGTLIDTGVEPLVTINGGTFTADPLTWMQPLPNVGQDAAALKAITGQPNLLTDPPGLPYGNPAMQWPASHTPLLGTPATPGVLIDVIPDSQCGGANQLLSPIDGSCIDKDVLGNDRWDTGNNRRNIGAIQLSLAPHLNVTGTGDGTVDLAWNRPQDPSSGAITGYAVLYRPAGSSDPFTRVDVSGPDTLTQQVTGLTNGTEYEFQVVGVNNVGDGPLSNLVKATPYGSINPPVVTATPGNTQVALTWTEPDTGGWPILSYRVYYRPVNPPDGPLTFVEETTSRTSLVTGLTNGVEYEFVVAVVTSSPTTSVGLAKATPFEAAVILTESFTVSRVEEGKTSGEGSIACYWVTLAGYPGSGDVVVTVGPPQNGEVTLNKTSVTLDGSNWDNLTATDTSNFVCVRPIDDKIADGGTQVCRDGNSDIVGNGSVVTDKECGDHTDTIPHSIASATAPDYTTSTPIERKQPDGTLATDNTVPMLIQDNDDAGVVLTESYGVSDLDEDGTPVPVACYWVTLTSQPTAAVTVTPQPNGQVSVQPTSLVLSSSNWDALGADGNKICIRPVQDNAVEGTPNQFCAPKKVDLYGTGAVDTQVCGSHLGAVAHSFSSSDAKYNGAGVPVSGNGPDLGNNGAGTIDVLIRDDESAGLVFNPTALNVLEGGVAEYSVRLRSQPTGNVSVTAQASSVTAAGVDATTLTFTPQNWNVAQTVSVTLPDDNDVNGIRTGGISHNVSSGDGHYNGLSGAPVTLPMIITDNDMASAVLSRGSVAVAEGGAGADYAVRLTVAPTADVVVTVDGDGQVTANPAQLTFTPANWNVAQSVSITAIDDAVDEGDVSSATIGHTASSSDPAYNGAAIATVLAEVTDNDTAALAVGATAAASIAEGASTSYGVALATQPTGPVQVFVVTDGKTSANPAVLTFDASNWNVAQTVTLTGADDDVDNAANVHTSLVTHVAVSGDGAYNGVSDESLRVDVVDNDVAAIRFSESNVRVAKDDQASYSVTLATRPLAPVVVELAPSSGVTVDASCAAASEGVSQCLVFTPENWNVAQSLTLTALTDAPEHIDHLAVSADAGYNGLNARLLVNGVGAPVNPVFLPLMVK